MRHFSSILLGICILGGMAFGQTADELIAKNIQAKGGMEKVKAINTVKMAGKVELPQFTARVEQYNKRTNMLRQEATIQGMTQVQAYDGSTGWQINPFSGRRDPEALGEDDLRDFQDQSDFDGPLVDYQAKGNKVDYLGVDQVDGDDAYKLKVTLKNGDIIYYYLDPETSLEIRKEFQEFIRGSIRESYQNLGSYKAVGGVMYPFSIEQGPKGDPSNLQKITYEKIEVNTPMQDSFFKWPAVPAGK